MADIISRFVGTLVGGSLGLGVPPPLAMQGRRRKEGLGENKEEKRYER